MSNSMATLTEAGIDFDTVPEPQRDVLASLSDEEAATLASIKTRLDEAGGDDVEAHNEVKYGGVFW